MKWVVLRGEHVLRSGTRPTPRDSADSVLAAVAGLAGQEAGLERSASRSPRSSTSSTGPRSWCPTCRATGPPAGRGPLRAALGVPVVRRQRRARADPGGMEARRGPRTRTPSCSRSGPASAAASSRTPASSAVRAAGRARSGTCPSSRRRAVRLRRDRLPGDGRGRPRPRPRRGGGGRRGAAPLLAGAGAVTPETVADAARRGDPGARASWIAPARASAAPSRRSPSPSPRGLRHRRRACARPRADASRDRRPVRERAPLYGTIPVVRSTLGLHAGAIGAALWKDDE